MRTTTACLAVLALACGEPTSPVPATPASGGETELTRENSYSINAAQNTMVVKIVQVRGESGEPIHAFIRKMFVSADSARAERLVIDLRLISGSDTRLTVPLIKGVATRQRFAQREGLFVVVGDESFSQSQRTATLLQRYANPIFVRRPPE
ncbi:MAG TPA: hypothetical protein VGJ62_11150 [Gemmatimonadaceae bacterium]|jgi:hypothetical protein